MNISPALDLIDADQAERIAHALPSLPIVDRCRCGDDDCETYTFKFYQQADKGRVVRFYVDGELVLHLNQNFELCEIERLHGDGLPKTVYALQMDGSYAEVAQVGGDLGLLE